MLISPLKTWTHYKHVPIHDKTLPIWSSLRLLNDCSEYYIDSAIYDSTKAINTGIYVPRGKDKLLIVSGESWTYGDSLNGVKASEGEDNVESRISNNFSGRIAQYLNADLLFKAIPGSGNHTIIHNLRSMVDCIQDHPNFKNYKEIYIIGQLTSPGRDFGLFELLGKDIKNPKFIDWFKLREKQDFDNLTEIAKELPNAKICIWKNFQDFINDYDVTESQSYIKKSWMNYTLNLHGQNDIELPMIMESTFWPRMLKNIYIFKNISNITQDINKDLEKLEATYDTLIKSTINNQHPDKTSHFLWAMNLIRQSNWKRDNRKT